MNDVLTINEKEITSRLSVINLINEDEVPEVLVYPMKTKSSAGNIRVQVVINCHDCIGKLDRQRLSFTFDKELVRTNKEINKQSELLKNFITYELAKRVKENTYNLFIPLLNEYVESKRGNLRDTSVDGYEYSRDRIINYFSKMEDITVEQISPKVINEFITYLQSKKGYSYRTVRSTHTLLYGFMKNCVVNEIIKINPCENTASLINRPKKNVEDNNFLFLSHQEFNSFFEWTENHANETYVKIGMMMYFGIVYGLRKEEVLALKWDCIDFETKHVIIKRTRTKAKKVYDFEDVKNKSSYRVYPITSEIEDILNKIISSTNSNNVDSGYVFYWDENEVSEQNKKFIGCPYRPDYINKIMKKMTRDYKKDCDIDISWLTFHKLRHSCVSILTLQGWSLEEIQKWVGHSDSETTKRIYQHFKPHWADCKVESLDSLWNRYN